MKIKKIMLASILILGSIVTTSCVKKKEPTSSNIPSTTVTVPSTTTTTTVPSITTTTGKPTVPSTTTTTGKPTVPSTTTTTSRPTVPSTTTTTSRPTVPSTTTTTSRPTVPSTTTTTGEPTVPSTTTTVPSTTTTTVPTTTTQPEITPGEDDEPTYEENGTNVGTLENGTGEVITEGTVEILGCSGLLESGYVTYKAVDAANSYNIYLTGEGYNDTLVDSKIAYTRAVSDTQVRTELLGLKEGTYQVKIVPVIAGLESTATATVVELGVLAYDRSGYAHFKYTDGVGAYNDDGTLKDNAIVIYVTDENKDYVMTDVCEEYDLDMFNIPNADKWNNKSAAGIGWWLNNAQYTKQGSNTYSATGKSLGFYSVSEDHPIVIRFVGTVTTPEGCTEYNSTNEGGSSGDNGHMARMKDLKNVTLEGVGFDAKIEGWGLHFMASDTTNGRGKGFEARNLTFDKYPEDALGMEGVQEDSSKTLKAPVERCWVHHCTFLPGYCANPAEGDKSEGDGSCDFKRGQYFTMSYCYYEYCHKTNLIGAGDNDLQFNISFHHNFWYNCGSRMPLTRQANVHFYNNYVYADITDDKADLSQVSSIRGNCYLYSENNYYEGCKNVVEQKNSGGVVKLFGNSYVSCYGDLFDQTGVTNASTRTQSIDTCNCAYQSISYKDFDTNPNLFYYNTETMQSDCYLTTSTIAREECIKFSGSYYRTILDRTSSTASNTAFNKYTPTTAIDLSSGSYTAVLPTTKDNQTIGGIMFNNISSVSSGQVKFGLEGVTFKLDTYATITVQMIGSKSVAVYAGSVVKSNGEVMLSGSGSAVLSPGIYSIVSCEMDGDTTITSLSFEKYNSEEVKAESIQNYNDAYNLIPLTIEYTDACYNKIKAAVDAYNALGEWKNEVSTTPYTAFDEYVSLGEAYVEGLISSIGTVTVDSGSAISNARLAYDKLVSIDSTAEVSNYSVLETAEETFKDFAVQSCINKITAIGTVTLDSKDLIDAARAEYNLLTTEQKGNVTNYSNLVEAEVKYMSLKAIDNVEKLIDAAIDATSIKAAVDAYNNLTSSEKELVSNSDKISNLQIQNTIYLIDAIPDNVTSSDKESIDIAANAYNTLSSDQKNLVTNHSKLQSAQEQLESLLNAMHTMSFGDGIVDPNGYFVISGNTSNGKGSITYGGVEYSTCLKIETSTSITFTTLGEATLTLVTDGISKKIKVDGNAYTIGTDGVLVLTLTAGSHTITKGDSLNLFYLIVE